MSGAARRTSGRARTAPVAAPAGASGISSGARPVLRVCRGGAARRVLAPLRRRAGAGGWPPPHAPLCQRPARRTLTARRTRSAELLISARREELLQPFLPQGCGPHASPAPTSRRLILRSALDRASEPPPKDLLAEP